MNIPTCTQCGSQDVYVIDKEERIPQWYCDNCQSIVWVVVLDSGSTYKVERKE